MITRNFFDNTINPLNIEPIEYKVLLKFIKNSEKTDGGIYLPDSVKEQQDVNNIIGELIKAGDLAFTDDDGDKWKQHPKKGDIVITNKYPGIMIYENESERWFLCNDKEICAIYNQNK